MHLGRGALAQLGERVVRNHEVRGSIPLCSTKTTKRANRPSFVGLCKECWGGGYSKDFRASFFFKKSLFSYWLLREYLQMFYL